jgi:hypothetical protein
MAMFFAYDETGLAGKVFNLDYVISFSFNFDVYDVAWARVVLNNGTVGGPETISLFGEDVGRLKNLIDSSRWTNGAAKDEPAQKP